MTTFRRFSGSGSRKLFVTGLVLALSSLLGVAIFGLHQAGAATCTDNDIIKCGFSSRDDFIDKVRANDNGVNDVPDLQSVYAHYGLSASDYSDFAKHAVAGEAMRDGRIIVNGQTVGTGGESVGRIKSFQGSNPFTTTIAGRNYYGNVNDQAFADGVSELPVYVLFDSTGNFKFAVMPSCGNPEFPKAPVRTSAACSVLNKTPVPGRANTYSFTAAATHQGNATITQFVYNFGDGSPAVIETDGSKPVIHTYKDPGTFTATVTVYANVPGLPKDASAPLPAVSMCAKQVTVAKPPTPPPAVVVACKQLTAVMVDDNKMSFTFTATGTSSGGPTLASADFDFGDGNKQSGVAPTSTGSMTATASHTYATAGTFTASAVLHFTGLDGKAVTADVCTATVTPAVAPTVPPVTPPTPAPAPPVLPNTGAGNIVALFSIVVIAGFVGYRQLLFRRHKHDS